MNARIIITRDGKVAFIGRGWLNHFILRVEEMTESSEYSNTMNSIHEAKYDIENFKQKFSFLFSREGNTKSHRMKIEFGKVDGTIGTNRTTAITSGSRSWIEKMQKDGHQKGRTQSPMKSLLSRW